MKVWIIYSSHRLTHPDGTVEMHVQQVRGKKRQHPNDALKSRGKTRSFMSTDASKSLAEFRIECRKKR